MNLSIRVRLVLPKHVFSEIIAMFLAMSYLITDYSVKVSKVVDLSNIYNFASADFDLVQSVIRYDVVKNIMIISLKILFRQDQSHSDRKVHCHRLEL